MAQDKPIFLSVNAVDKVLNQGFRTADLAHGASALSTTEITDASGNIANSYKYDAWGNLLDSSNITVDNDFTYVGSYGLMANDSGTYYVRARNYDAENGRWISADPIGIEGGNNLYGYCGNSPSQRVDINGYGHFYYWALGEYSAPKNFWEKIGSKLSTAFVVVSRVLDRFDLVVAHEQYILDDYDKSSWGFGVLPDTGAY